MRIYISADMEGTAGVCSWDQVDARNYTADYFIELMPGYQRIAGRTIRFEANDYPAIFRAFVAAFRLGGAANTRA